MHKKNRKSALSHHAFSFSWFSKYNSNAQNTLNSEVAKHTWVKGNFKQIIPLFCSFISLQGIFSVLSRNNEREGKGKFQKDKDTDVGEEGYRRTLME